MTRNEATAAAGMLAPFGEVTTTATECGTVFTVAIEWTRPAAAKLNRYATLDKVVAKLIGLADDAEKAEREAPRDLDELRDKAIAHAKAVGLASRVAWVERRWLFSVSGRTREMYRIVFDGGLMASADTAAKAMAAFVDLCREMQRPRYARPDTPTDAGLPCWYADERPGSDTPAAKR